MRDYGRVAPTFWTRGSGKKLRGKPGAQVVALYLFTCPASTMIGIYHLAIPTMAHETGLTVEAAERALAEVCELGIAQYDPEEELVYLPEGARYQIGERLKPGDKRVAGIRSALAQFARHPFALDFARRYAADFCLPAPQGDAPSPPPPKGSEPDQEAPSIPLPAFTGSPLEARQGKEQDQKQAQKQEQSRGRASARDEGKEQDDPEPTPETIDGKLLAALRASPGIVRYEQEGTLRLADCAATLAGEVASYEMGRGLPIEAGLERAFAALADVEKKVTAAALTSEPWPPARVAEKLRTFTQGNLGKSREAWEADQRRASGDRPSEPGTVSDDARVALEVFAEVWATKKRRAFVQAVGDEKHAAALVEAARPVAAQLKIAGRDVVRFWAERYLADGERFVADAEHPLRLLPGRLTTYGAPPAKKKPTAAFGASEPAKTPEAPAVLPPPDWLEKLAAVGTAGNTMTRRPS